VVVVRLCGKHDEEFPAEDMPGAVMESRAAECCGDHEKGTVVTPEPESPPIEEG
jgi:hypothetical protein